MFPFPSMLGAAGGAALTFRGLSGFAGNGSASRTISWSGIGAQPGDIALVAYFYPSPSDATLMPLGWNKTTLSSWPTYHYTPAFYWKVLTSGDIASGSTITGLTAMANQDSVVYASWGGGGAVMTLLGQGTDLVASTTHTTGSVSAGGSIPGYIAVFQSQQNDTTASANNTFTSRGHAGTVGGGAASSMQAIADSAGGAYTGSAVTWTIGASGSYTGWFILKVT